MTNAQNTGKARRSALLVGAVLATLAAWNLYRGRLPAAWLLASPGGLLILIGLFAPPLAEVFHKNWMRLALALGYVNSRILLSAMYYLCVTPIGLVMRLFGRDPLNRRMSGQSSYWVPRTITRQTREGFERAF